jgi:hypothetical protein
MSQQRHPLYVSEAANTPPVTEILPSFGKPFRRCSPASLSGDDVCQSPLIVLDGASLGEKSIGIARRLRWLGFSGELLLSAAIDSALDRAIARESGVTDFLCPPPASGIRKQRRNESKI